MRRAWTKREDNFLRRNLNRLHTLDICEKLKRTKPSIWQHAGKLKLKRTARIVRPPKNAWNKTDKQFLRRNLNRMTCREIGTAIGRSKIAVAGMLNKLGLKRTPAARKRMVDAGLFRLHSQPWNKGLKGYHASPATEFKKGHKPVNTKFDGCIRIRWHVPSKTPYKFIRAEGKWELLNRWKWKKHHGRIPAKHIVAFKNGDTLDCRLSNLFLLSHADNARRNQNIEKARIGLRRAWNEGRFLASDKFIAFTLAPNDGKLRKSIRKHPDLIEAKRQELQLRRTIRNAAREKA